MFNAKWMLFPPHLSAYVDSQTTLIYTQPEQKQLWQADYALFQSPQLKLDALRRSGKFSMQFVSHTGQRSHLNQDIQAAPELKLVHPKYLVEDDLLQIKYEIKNPLAQARDFRVEILNQTFAHQLNANESTLQVLTQKFEIPGNRSLEARLFYEQAWYNWPGNIYVFPQRKNRMQSAHELKWVVPIRDPLPLGGEIPVMLEFEHHYEKAVPLGIQLGIPAGFTAIQGNQKDFKDWLLSAEPALAYLNLTTKAIPPNQRYYYQFRLRSHAAGIFHFPAHRIFPLQDSNAYSQLQIAEPLMVVN